MWSNSMSTHTASSSAPRNCSPPASFPCARSTGWATPPSTAARNGTSRSSCAPPAPRKRRSFAHCRMAAPRSNFSAPKKASAPVRPASSMKPVTAASLVAAGSGADTERAFRKRPAPVRACPCTGTSAPVQERLLALPRLYDLGIGPAKLQGHGDRGIIAVTPEPAVLSGKPRLDPALALGRTPTPVIIDGLPLAMRVQVEIDPSACRTPGIGRNIARLHHQLDLRRRVRLQREADNIRPRLLLRLRGPCEQAQHIPQQAR